MRCEPATCPTPIESLSQPSRASSRHLPTTRKPGVLLSSRSVRAPRIRMRTDRFARTLLRTSWARGMVRARESCYAPYGTSATDRLQNLPRVLGYRAIRRGARVAVDRARLRSGGQGRDLGRVETSTECSDVVSVWRAGAGQNLREFGEVALVTWWCADEQHP